MYAHELVRDVPKFAAIGKAAEAINNALAECPEEEPLAIMEFILYIAAKRRNEKTIFFDIKTS